MSIQDAERLAAGLDEDERAAKAASGGTVIGEAGNWQPSPDGDEWEVYADLTETDRGKDGDLELLVALRPGLPRPPEVMGGYWGSVISWHRDYADRDAWVPEPQLRHAARHDPARVRADIAAKRRILAEYEEARAKFAEFSGSVDRELSGWWAGRVVQLERDIAALAAVYQDVPAETAG